MELYPVVPPVGWDEHCTAQAVAFPPQHQSRQPGLEWKMQPRPIFDDPSYRGSGKLEGRVAIITGGDSGIGRAVAVAFAKEGARALTIVYYDEHRDAEETAGHCRAHGTEVLLIAGDLRQSRLSRIVVEETRRRFGRIDVLVLNQAVQFPQHSIEDISDAQLETTFACNVFPHFYMARAALPHLGRGASIISTASVTAYRGSPLLVDYSATKGAIVSFTRSLALQLVPRGIRCNAVSPGPTWTPLITSSFDAQHVSHFGDHTGFGRAAQPFELAPTYVYLASRDSTFVSGQVLHVNGGIIT